MNYKYKFKKNFINICKNNFICCNTKEQAYVLLNELSKFNICLGKLRNSINERFSSEVVFFLNISEGLSCYISKDVSDKFSDEEKLNSFNELFAILGFSKSNKIVNFTELIDEDVMDYYKQLNIVIHKLLSYGINKYRLFELTNALANGKNIEEALKFAGINPEKYEGVDTNELYK